MSPPLLHRYRLAGGSSYWSLEEPSQEQARVAAQYDAAAAAPGCSGAKPGCSSSAGPSSLDDPDALDELAASVDVEVDTLFASLGGRFADEDDRCPYSLSCNDSIALDLDRTHLTYGEITARSLLEVLRDGARPTRTDVLLDLGSGAGRAVLGAAAAGGVGYAYGLELLPSLVALSQASNPTPPSLPACSPVRAAWCRCRRHLPSPCAAFLCLRPQLSPCASNPSTIKGGGGSSEGRTAAPAPGAAPASVAAPPLGFGARRGFRTGPY